MLFIPGHSWNFTASNVSATRPAAGWGASVTPGTAGAFGSWVQLLAGTDVTTEVFGILIHINNGSTAATTRNQLVDIGIDTAGGTSYTTVIPTLMGGHASPATIGGIFYYFPLYIPAGSSIAARATGTAATAFNVNVTVFGKPRRPDAVLCGTKVSAFGATLNGGTGTTVTPGTTADGAWAQLGSATTHSIWWWQAGLTFVDTTITGSAYTIDVATGDATNKDIVLQDVLIGTTSSEQINNFCACVPAYDRTPSGVLVYGRSQCSGTADSAASMIAYGLG